jgi:hypothetical protein
MQDSAAGGLAHGLDIFSRSVKDPEIYIDKLVLITHLAQLRRKA